MTHTTFLEVQHLTWASVGDKVVLRIKMPITDITSKMPVAGPADLRAPVLQRARFQRIIALEGGT